MHVCETGHTGLTTTQIYSRSEESQQRLIYGCNIIHVLHVKVKNPPISHVH